ncbi:VIT1/CCC1 family predicted Fe2+/Mn2+ transporter [Limimaricola variabilis]|uniref:VIT1/CCC1 family predicted Fe2+/Mn2+ transporter n=1 Tax=Limimaricola variabilis TaxID=1492771 RepID=A0ABR6HMM1_9RHOB|nr:VIT1/CCC1 transporter family protein [Limimaricola variabilis]MBB3711798.1 VIT1/CCC1 family predicted Fe2+/Mn2+ transporter [Limimaricola variabilis]
MARDAEGTAPTRAMAGLSDGDHGHGREDIARRLDRASGGGAGHLKDFVYGAIDGAVTTFAIVAGVQGAGFSPGIILALGTADVLADGFSMAASNYSGTKAERDDMERLRAVEERHIELYPEGEREELRQILQAKGLEGEVLDQAVAAIAQNRGAWVQMMLVDEYGLNPRIPDPRKAALATFAAFLAAGMVPLLPFAIGLNGAFGLSILSTAATFFVIGALKSRWSLSPWWRSGLETLLIGGMAASIAYLVGSMLRGG